MVPQFCTKYDPYFRLNGNVCWRLQRKKYSDTAIFQEKSSNSIEVTPQTRKKKKHAIKQVKRQTNELNQPVNGNLFSNISCQKSALDSKWWNVSSTKITSQCKYCGSIINLPLEIWDIIFGFVVRYDQENHWSTEIDNHFSLLLIAPDLTSVAIKYIYQHPKLTSQNFTLFHKAIAKNPELGNLIQVLDFSNISNTAKNSMTSRLIRKSSKSLMEFIAPQSNLGLNSLRSLSYCSKLRKCDLSCVSERIDLTGLIASISNLKSLESFAFPRCSVQIQGPIKEFIPKLKQLTLAGGITDNMVCSNMTFPKTLNALTISFCPLLSDMALVHLTSQLGSQLESLEVFYPMPGLSRNALDSLFVTCSNLRKASLSVEYFSSKLFENIIKNDKTGGIHPLEHLEIHSSGQLLVGKIRADDLAEPLIECRLPNLKLVKVSIRLWRKDSTEVLDLVDLIEDLGGRFRVMSI